MWISVCLRNHSDFQHLVCLDFIYLLLNYSKKKRRHNEGGWTWEYVAQKGCGAFIIKEIQDLTGQGSGQSPLADPTLNRALTELPPEVLAIITNSVT